MKLRIHPNAQEDIKQLMAKDINVFGRVFSLLREVLGAPDLIEQMNVPGVLVEFESGERIDCLKFQAVRKAADMWRLKCWDSPHHSLPYRILYAFFPAGQTRTEAEIEILAVVHRNSFNYETDHPITRRVIADYNERL